MGTNNLTDRANGQVITESFFNDIHQALDGDMVGRNSSGAATSGQNLGTAAIPWGVVRGTSLVIGGSTVDTTQIPAPQNRVVSGQVRSTSSKTDFLRASGSGATATIEAASTNLVLDINGTSYTVSSDIAITGLTVAPSSNNTALVNDLLISSDFYAGEVDATIPYITIDTVGSEISGAIGQWVTLKTSTEYMFAYVESATKLTNVYRGFFFDSSGNPLKRVGITDNDTLTIMETGWTFVDDDTATSETVYTSPLWSFTAPSSPSTGDYWYDLSAQTWKRYSGSSFEVIGRVLVGILIIDATDCVASRSVDQYFNPKDTGIENFELEVESTEIVRTINYTNRLYVYGNEFVISYSPMTWNITTDLDSGVSEATSSYYYMYVKQNGDTVISDQKPYLRTDLNGKFHPYESWLYVGIFFNDGSDDITGVGDESRFVKFQNNYLASDVSANTSNITSLRYDNLILGRIYRLTISAYVVVNATGTSENCKVWAEHNSVRIARVVHDNNGSYNNALQASNVSPIFTATTNSIIFHFSESSASTLFGDGTSSESYATLEDVTATHKTTTGLA